MRELWKETERGHEEVGEAAAAFGIDQLIGIGEWAQPLPVAAEKAGLENSSVVDRHRKRSTSDRHRGAG
jgi:hypothetical protein